MFDVLKYNKSATLYDCLSSFTYTQFPFASKHRGVHVNTNIIVEIDFSLLHNMNTQMQMRLLYILRFISLL